jgi:hypothetical protein
MTRAGRLTVSLIITAGALVRGTVVDGAQVATNSESSVARTQWGEPDLRGTYSPAVGVWSTSCGAIDMIALMQSPLYAGLTHIDQFPGIVRIRNQFSRARVVFVGGSQRSRHTGHAWWEGTTLIIESSGVTERLTRLGDDAIHYDYAVRDEVGDGSGRRVGFPLTRALARGGFRPAHLGLCGDAAVD